MSAPNDGAVLFTCHRDCRVEAHAVPAADRGGACLGCGEDAGNIRVWWHRKASPGFEPKGHFAPDTVCHHCAQRKHLAACYSPEQRARDIRRERSLDI